MSGAQIVSAGAASNQIGRAFEPIILCRTKVAKTTNSSILTAGNHGGKSTLIGANQLVKLVTPPAVGGNKILMKNSNLVQVGKMGTSTNKPAFVITNKQVQSKPNRQN